MKRVFATLAAAAAVFTLLAGCSAGSGTPPGGAADSVMEVLDADMLAIYDSRGTKLPAAVIYVFQGNGERVELPLYGSAEVNAVLDAIADLTVTGETEMTVADSDTSYIFLNADGTKAGSVSFNGRALDCGGKKYEVDGWKGLAAIDFPAVTDRDTLTLDGPDPRMREFLARCKTEEPASIEVVRGGSAREITNPETIRAAVDALYGIRFASYALQGAETPSTSLTATFLLRDGWKYSLTFYDDDVYIYEYPQPLGTWSFYTDGAELFLGILAEDGSGQTL